MTADAGVDAAPAVPTGFRAQPGLAKLGLIFTYLACFTTPWTAVDVGPVRAGDLFLLLAMGCLLLAGLDVPLPRYPEWVWFFAACIVAVGVLNELFPVSPSYLSERVFPLANGAVSIGAPAVFSNFGVMVKFLVPIVGLPLVFGLARGRAPRALTFSALAFAAGAAVSGLFAFTDVEGLTHIAQSVSGISVVDNRGSGLTEHPNYVAMGCVFGLPFLLWQLLAPKLWVRVVAYFALAALLLGLYASGSRSGGGAGAAALLLSIALIPRFRPVLPTVLLLAGSAIAVTFVVVPSLGHDVLKALRLTGGAGTGSDAARDIINTQAQHDFAHSPLFGIGLQVAGDAHIVYLQALAAGGVILLTGYVLFLLGALVRSWRARPFDPIAAPLFVSVLAGTIFNAAQDALTIRIVYVPATLAAALLLRRQPQLEAELAAERAVVPVPESARA